MSAADREPTAVLLDDHAPLASVGLVCVCGKPVASIEGVARRCVCGRVWIISAMLIGAAAAEPEKLLTGNPCHVKRDGTVDLARYSDDPGYASRVDDRAAEPGNEAASDA